MVNDFLRKFIAVMLIVPVFAIGMPRFALADMIGTQTLIEQQARQQRLDRVDRFLAREDVRRQLESLGVDPADARTRVAALTDSELQQLTRHMDEMPAGGILALIGAVFVVLLILELVGVTHVFSRI